jgi:ABC-type nickel/cobalt efflux system permease component RcnA
LTRFLLVAAYLAAHNEAQTDLYVFTARSKRRKRTRGDAQAEAHVEQEQRAAMVSVWGQACVCALEPWGRASAMGGGGGEERPSDAHSHVHHHRVCVCGIHHQEEEACGEEVRAFALERLLSIFSALVAYSRAGGAAYANRTGTVELLTQVGAGRHLR